MMEVAKWFVWDLEIHIMINSLLCIVMSLILKRYEVQMMRFFDISECNDK